jgi:hypothetical protein
MGHTQASWPCGPPPAAASRVMCGRARSAHSMRAHALAAVAAANQRRGQVMPGLCLAGIRKACGGRCATACEQAWQAHQQASCVRTRERSAMGR